jgi:hypothetical protein
MKLEPSVLSGDGYKTHRHSRRWVIEKDEAGIQCLEWGYHLLKN